jgi:Kef-type K+ transport system membrane component KefB
VARGEQALADRLEPLSSFLVPIFFVVLGMRADVRALARPESLGLLGLLTLAAILGKLLCAFGAPRGADGLTIALGMVPRGEVTLVFANLGRTLSVGGHPLLVEGHYSALVALVLLTTIVGPVSLRARLRALANRATHGGSTVTPAANEGSP